MQNDVETILEEGVDYIETYETSQLSIKPKYYKQTYRSAWEQMPDFKGTVILFLTIKLFNLCRF